MERSMSPVLSGEHQEVDRLKESLGDCALGDVKKALAGGAKVGSFLLAAHFIDVLARLARTTTPRPRPPARSSPGRG